MSTYESFIDDPLPVRPTPGEAMKSDLSRAEAFDQFREAVERYERFLRALTSADTRVALLDKSDLGEWAEEQAQALLDGGEAECPNCCTPLHDGACAGEDGDAVPARCRVCGCTDLDCRGCIERTGRACWWIEPDLCSACSAQKKGGAR